MALALARNLSWSVLFLLLLEAAAAAQQAEPRWQFGGFADVAHLFDGNQPPNHDTRSRGTTWRVNESSLNMAALTLHKPSTARSRWGAELFLQTGRDTEKFAFSATAPNAVGSNWLRYVGRANVTYASASGWRVQGGLFSSLIGYDSLYAKDNLTYTRPWTADFTPYVMLGANLARPIGDRVTLTVFGVNGYWHLAHANNVPNGGAQLAYANGAMTIKQTLLIGPHQAGTSLHLWRILSDTIVERRHTRWVAAVNGQAGTERVDSVNQPRAWWLAAQMPFMWRFTPRWSAAARTEVAWDSRGRWTMFEQTVTAWTATLEYRRAVQQVTSIVRLEYRHDTSRGPQGGFFAAATAGGPSSLVPSQNLVIVSFLFNYR